MVMVTVMVMVMVTVMMVVADERTNEKNDVLCWSVDEEEREVEEEEAKSVVLGEGRLQE